MFKNQCSNILGENTQQDKIYLNWKQSSHTTQNLWWITRKKIYVRNFNSKKKINENIKISLCFLWIFMALREVSKMATIRLKNITEIRHNLKCSWKLTVESLNELLRIFSTLIMSFPLNTIEGGNVLKVCKNIFVIFTIMKEKPNSARTYCWISVLKKRYFR